MNIRLPRLQNPSAAVYVIPAILAVGGIAYFALREPKAAKRPAAPQQPIPPLTASPRPPRATIPGRPDLLLAAQLRPQPKTTKGGGGGPPAKSPLDPIQGTVQHFRRNDTIPNVSGNAKGWNPSFFGGDTPVIALAGVRSRLLPLGYPMNVFTDASMLSYSEQQAIAEFQDDWNAVIAALDDGKFSHPLFDDMRGLLESIPGSLGIMQNLTANEKATLRAVEIASIADSSFNSPEMKWSNLVDTAKS